jgi:hypothetical protein
VKKKLEVIYGILCFEKDWNGLSQVRVGIRRELKMNVRLWTAVDCLRSA